MFRITLSLRGAAERVRGRRRRPAPQPCPCPTPTLTASMMLLAALSSTAFVLPGSWSAQPVQSHAASLAMSGALDRGFVKDITARCLPSVVLVTPLDPRDGPRARARERRGRSTGQGSGIAVRYGEETFVLTSAHCLQGGMGVEVSLASDAFEAQHEATVIGRGADGLDLAVLRIPAAAAVSLTPLEFATTAPTLGEFAIAIGNAGNVRPAVSLGIVSGVSDFLMKESQAADRERRGPKPDPPYVVTDAALAGGMSGGPLLNDEGLVMGVCTLVRPQQGGIGNYAISALRASEALVEIMAEAESLPTTGNQLTLYLCNDRVNKRSRVEGVLKKAGLDDDAARSAMMAAHRTGRGAVRTWQISDPAFETEAEALRAELANGDLLVELERS